MRWVATLRWSAFALYCIFVFAFPLWLLWEFQGAVIGGAVGIGALVAMRWNAVQRIHQSIEARAIHRAENPVLFHIVDALSQRLGIASPEIRLIDSRALNCAVYGFAQSQSTLALTTGLISGLNRPQLIAVISRALCQLAATHHTGLTWLARFFSFMTVLATYPHEMARPSPAPFTVLLRQALLYPLVLFPTWILGRQAPAERLDAWATRLCSHSRDLAEAFRRIEALAERTSFHVPFSARHLFLFASSTVDPLADLLLTADSLKERIGMLETPAARTTS